MSYTQEETQIELSADHRLAAQLGVNREVMLKTIKRQCFRGIPPEKVTNEQMVVYVQIANELRLNPMLPGMLYAYPDRGGAMIPIVGPDGVYQLLSSHPRVKGWKVWTEDDGADMRAIAHISVDGYDAPLEKICYLSEWKVDSNPNWKSRPRHMLELRALKQCARQVIHGMPMDADEREMATASGSLQSKTVSAPPDFHVREDDANPIEAEVADEADFEAQVTEDGYQPSRANDADLFNEEPESDKD